MAQRCFPFHDWCHWPQAFEGELSGAYPTIPEHKIAVSLKTNICVRCHTIRVEVVEVSELRRAESSATRGANVGPRFRADEISMGRVVRGPMH